MQRRRGLIAANVAALALLGFALVETGHPATDRAIAEISQRVAYVQNVIPTAPREYVAALAVNSYVVGHVSATAYGYLESQGSPIPQSVEAILQAGAGICGEASSVAVALDAALGVRARRLVVWYRLPDGARAGHSTVEVFYAGSWHWFDPTWGEFYRSPAADPSAVDSLVDVIQMTRAQRAGSQVVDAGRLWYDVSRAAGTLEAGPDFVDTALSAVDLDDGTLLWSAVDEARR